jgi:hypothetical protein
MAQSLIEGKPGCERSQSGSNPEEVKMFPKSKLVASSGRSAIRIPPS